MNQFQELLFSVEINFYVQLMYFQTKRLTYLSATDDRMVHNWQVC